jgi:DNA replication protein DnaC
MEPTKTQELVSRALTPARTPSTTGLTIPAWTVAILNLFKTNLPQPDPELVSMKEAARQFLGEMHSPPGSGVTPRWLSFCGVSGTGKTFLCELIRQGAPEEFKDHPSFPRAGAKLNWPNIIWKLRDRTLEQEARGEIDDALRHQLVFIDDIGGSKDSEFSASALFRIIERRCGRWTLITANRDLQQISDTIDPRIADRLVRDQNVCLKVNTVSYSKRKK